MPQHLIDRMFFCYNVKATALANGATTTQKITISSESRFLLKNIRSTGTTDVFITISLQEGQQFSNSPLDSGVLAGSNGDGIKFFPPNDIIFPKNTIIQILIDNESGNAVTEEVQLWGHKID